MEELEVTLTPEGTVSFLVVARSDASVLHGLENDWWVSSLTLRGAKKLVTSDLVGLGWAPVGRWIGNTRRFVVN